MSPPDSRALGDIHVVDPHLLGTPGALSLYVVDAPEPAIVDAGAVDSVPRIYDALAELGIAREDVAHALVSHVHLDHAAGAGHLAEGLPNATVHVHQDGLPYLTRADRLARLRRSVDLTMGVEDAYGEPKLLSSDRCRAVSGGETVDLGDRVLELIDAPGHAPHHFAAFDPETRAVFAIDAAGMYLGEQLYPTTPPPSFDLAASLDTIDRLRGYEPGTVLYGHFGPGSGDAVDDLDRYGSLLVDWVELIDERRRQFDGRGDAIVDDIVDTLGRQWQSPTVHRDVAGVLGYLNRRWAAGSGEGA